jgi:hypothetical protein
LAIAVIGGLSLSTVFTLIFMPVVYRFIARHSGHSAVPIVPVIDERVGIESTSE